MAIKSDELTGDIRVKRTRSNYREAFLTLCKNKPFGEITISDLSNTIGVGRSTFRHHYDTTADLMLDVEQNLFKEIKSEIDATESDNDLSRYIYVIYKHMYQYGDSMITLLYNPDYSSFSKKFKDDVLGLDCFRPFYEKSASIPAFIIKGFFSCIFSIYYSWYYSAVPEFSLEQLAEECADRILHGGLSQNKIVPHTSIPKDLKSLREEYGLSEDTLAQAIGLKTPEYETYEKDSIEKKYSLPDEFIVGLIEFFKEMKNDKEVVEHSDDIPDWALFFLEYALYKYKDDGDIPRDIRNNMLSHEALDTAEKAVMAYTMNKEGNITEKRQLADRFIRSADRRKQAILDVRGR